MNHRPKNHNEKSYPTPEKDHHVDHDLYDRDPHAINNLLWVEISGQEAGSCGAGQNQPISLDIR